MDTVDGIKVYGWERNAMGYDSAYAFLCDIVMVISVVMALYAFVKIKNKKEKWFVVICAFILMIVFVQLKVSSSENDNGNTGVGNTPSPAEPFNTPQPTATSEVNVSPTSKEPYVVGMESLTPYVIGCFGLGRVYSTEDTLGNIYAFSFRGYMDIEDEGAYEIFAIDSKYAELHATVAVDKTGYIEERYVGHIKIYGDDRLIWADDIIKAATKPYDITVDIRGVEDLRIEMYGDGNMGNSGISVLLCNPQLISE